MESEPARSAMVRESLKEMDSAQILWNGGQMPPKSCLFASLLWVGITVYPKNQIYYAMNLDAYAYLYPS